MNRARHAFLPSTALALDEDGGRAVRHLLDERHHAAEGGAAADHGALGPEVFELLLECAVLLDQRASLERLADDLQQLLAAERLGDEVVGAVLHRVDGFFDRAERGEEDHVDVRRQGLGRAEQLDAGEPGHLEIAEDQVETPTLDAVERGAAVGREHDAIAGAGQRALQAFAQSGVVVGDEERRPFRHARLA